MLLLVTGVACRDLVGNAALPPGTQSPNTYNTPAGALSMYRGTKGQATTALITVGALTDELTGASLGSSPLSVGAIGDPIDERILPEGPGTGGPASSNTDYGKLQELRGSASETIGLLRTYIPDAPALRGEMYALEGHAEVVLAELYCSGIPLSTLDFQQDFTYKPSSTTDQVLQHAIVLFDSALAISSDSPSVMWLASVEKGRALTDLGQYAQAAQAVTTVPDVFRYQIPFRWGGLSGTAGIAFEGFTVADREGSNGLPYTSSGDPRAPVTSAGNNDFGVPLFIPTQYPKDTPTSVVLASGVEARLIEAEAALNAGDASGWLAKLNQLRTNGVLALTQDTVSDTLGVTGCDPANICGTGPSNDPSAGQPASGFQVPAGYSLASVDTTYPAPSGIQDYCNSASWYTPCYAGDTMVVYVYTTPVRQQWQAGTGGVAGLPPLSDPGSDTARVTLLFTERAYWLFLTGHRQGDLRRLVRRYGRPEDTVYPTGPYFGGQGAYGSDVTLPIPSSERPNPLFHGCLDREA